ncbi:MAG: guanylyltransferase [Armatimonadetes bacterium]|nr:guanylyltransferase [Armatimonadota bacterium]
MKFEILDAQMRALETQGELRLARDGLWIARLDGRGFTRLTKELLTLEKPFDARFHDAMSTTLAHLFRCGFTLRLGYSQSDEISLLFEPNGVPFERKTRKILSVLAGEASACFSLALGTLGAFDCRLSHVLDENGAIDYFRWRQADAARNALSAHCYWILRRQGHSPKAATKQLDGLSLAQKRTFLSENDVDFEALPRWQTRGFAARYETFEKEATDRKSGASVRARRKRLVLERELPSGDEFGAWLREILGEREA